jgi:hypothetical protein
MNLKSKLRILSICDDDAIRFSRELTLLAAGYEDVEWLPSNACLDAAHIRSLDVAILCQSVDWRRAARLAIAFRRLNPSLRILRVNTLRSEMESWLQVDCEVITGPGMLVEVLDSHFAGAGNPFAHSGDGQTESRLP